MNLHNQNVLLFLRATQHGGTENVVLQLCKILKSQVNKIVVCSADGFKTEYLDVLGVKYYTISDIENKTPKNVISVLKSVGNIIKQEKITIVHTHHRMAAFYTAILLKKYRFCFINTSHNTFFNRKFLTKRAYKQANLIACGGMVKKNLVDYFGLDRDKVTVIHNAVETFEECIIKDKLLSNLKQQGFYLIGNVGRLSAQKGMEYFIRSIPMVLDKHPMTKFVIIGSGEDEEKLKKLVQSLKIENSVLFMGYRADVQNLMSQLDFVVLSSLWEGLPLTPIEAFSVRKTIIATAVDGTVEIVKDGVNGVLVPAKDVEQLSVQMCKLIKDSNLRSILEKNAYKTYLEEFSFDRYREKVIKYYQSC